MFGRGSLWHHHLTPRLLPQELLAFLLSPEARDLRPVLVAELTHGLDLFLRDRLRRTAASAATLLPRLPGPLGMLVPGASALPAAFAGFSPPVPVPGRGLLPASQLVEELAPPLSQPDAIYLQTLVELAASLLGVEPAELETPDARLLSRLLLSPSEQVRELQGALTALAGGNGGADPAVVREMAASIVDSLMGTAAERLGVDDVNTLFPMRRGVLAVLQQQAASGAAGAAGAVVAAAASTAVQQQSEQAEVLMTIDSP